MATGRTHRKYIRFYGDGFDLSGHTMDVGPLGITFAEAGGVGLTDVIQGVLPDQGEVQVGTLNGLFDNTVATGLHTVWNAAGVKREIMVPWGIRAAPAEGDPVFCATVEQLGYQAQPTAGQLVTVSIPFGHWALDATSLLYSQVWGDLAHEKSAETGVNTGTATIDEEAQTTAGGYMAYQLFTSNGTVTIKIQDASTNSNPSFGDLVSSGVIDASATPAAAIVVLGKTATVERYIRWQIVLGTATTATFALAFVRGVA